jgi:hypothetical protein
MSKVMVTIRSPDHRPTLAEVQQHYGLRDSDIDPQFGVVEIDPREHLFTILVEPAAAEKITGQPGEWQAEGPYANPAIGPFGPAK